MRSNFFESCDLLLLPERIEGITGTTW